MPLLCRLSTWTSSWWSAHLVWFDVNRNQFSWLCSSVSVAFHYSDWEPSPFFPELNPDSSKAQSNVYFFLFYLYSQDLLILTQLTYMSFFFSQRYPGNSHFLPPSPEEFQRPKNRTPKIGSRDDRKTVFRFACVFCHELLKSLIPLPEIPTCVALPCFIREC